MVIYHAVTELRDSFTFQLLILVNDLVEIKFTKISIHIHIYVKHLFILIKKEIFL